MALKPKLTKFSTASEALASFDFQDLASGLNFQNFFAALTDLTAGAEFILVDDSSILSGKISTNRTGAGTTTLTFDSSPFNLARSVRGTAVFSCGVGGANTASMVVTARLQKWDGSSATNISSVITSANFTTATPILDKMILLQLPLTETIIAEGEQLRLLVTFQTTNGISNN